MSNAVETQSSDSRSENETPSPSRAMWLVAVLAVSLMGVAVAIPQSASAQDDGSKTKTLKVDPVHSDFLARATHFGASLVFVEFNDISGTVKFNPDKPSESSVNLTVKAASLESHNEKRNNHLKSPDFLHAKKYPEITFESTKVKAKDGKTYEVTGDLTIRGVTKTITVDVKHVGTGKGPKGKMHYGFYSEFGIDRTDFDIDWKKDAGIVGKKLHLIVAVEAIGEK